MGTFIDDPNRVVMPMTIARLLPFHMHGAFEAALAPVLMVAPFLLGFEWPAAIASVLIGVLILAVALATHAGEESTLPISTHVAFDVCFVVAMALSAVAFAFAGDVAAAAFLGPAALVLVLLMSFTRYSPSRA
jgi:hypothetical protein